MMDSELLKKIMALCFCAAESLYEEPSKIYTKESFKVILIADIR